FGSRTSTMKVPMFHDTPAKAVSVELRWGSGSSKRTQALTGHEVNVDGNWKWLRCSNNAADDETGMHDQSFDPRPFTSAGTLTLLGSHAAPQSLHRSPRRTNPSAAAGTQPASRA